ncbi:CYTH and CHAD domain-containing protein [Aquabacterium sp. A7-Y]|uniref:CYTH and CHAD domain-containing protein n=1 Tax=Aquabacterium sp. A7-Y TaxID=1349605 RepID=UPI00223DFCC7|nr:CYTH and CHAD domain-containing protein [Aquabacterium sp. A7-Y]MCW7539944.1 CYTH and CHAD domain-containing protein [Aquabacterium sp. A7-Y]
MSEFELKFEVPADCRDRLEAALQRGHWTATRLQADYFDTPDGRLARDGLSLRVRKEGRRWVQTLKAAGPSQVERLEHEVALQAPPRGQGPSVDPGLHADTPAGELLKRCLQPDGAPHGAALPPLQNRYRIDVSRQTRELRVPGGGLVELAFDEGCIRAGEREQPLCEIELELKRGPREAVLKIARRWAVQHGLWLNVISKGQRGERLARGAAHGPVVKAHPPGRGRPRNGDAEVRAVVGACLDQILPNASEVGQGRYNEDHVHQLRVGIRRLRTALRELGPLSPAVKPEWEAPLSRVFQALGEFRDRDTVLKAVQPQLASAGAPPIDMPEPGKVADPARVIQDTGFQTTLLELIEFSVAAPSDAGPAGTPKATREAAGRRIRKLHRQVVRDGKRFTKLDITSQHRVRKRLKRLRYLAEFVAPLFGEGAVEDYLAHLRPAQDALGLHNDDAVALAHYREAAARDPRAWFAIGWLSARSELTALHCRKALKVVAEAPRFWKK